VRADDVAGGLPTLVHETASTETTARVSAGKALVDTRRASRERVERLLIVVLIHWAVPSPPTVPPSVHG
jgi:hypothetical protein